MNIDFPPPSNGVYNNAGSSRQLVNYLEHEDIVDLVLFSTLDGKFYLSFGFPSSKIDLLSPMPEDAESWYTEVMIKENYKKREAEWTKFIHQLKLERKYID